MNDTYPYLASMTKEPFLFYEMRATARVSMDGLTDEEITKKLYRKIYFSIQRRDR